MEGGVNAQDRMAKDGSGVVSWIISSKVKRWDAATGDEVLTARGHNRKITCVAMSPDGRQIASGSHDQTVRIWNPATGREASHFMLTTRLSFGQKPDFHRCSEQSSCIQKDEPNNRHAPKRLSCRLK